MDIKPDESLDSKCSAINSAHQDGYFRGYFTGAIHGVIIMFAICWTVRVITKMLSGF